MGLSKKRIEEIENVVKNALRKKFQNYNPEPAYKPFHTRLLGKDRMALFAFIHSLNTNFGTSIFEPVALALAKKKFMMAECHQVAGNQISEETLFVIQRIMDNLTSAQAKPDKEKEIEMIRKVAQQGVMRTVKPTTVDVMLKDKAGKIFLIDIKTAKPNKGAFKEFKRTLLEWVGVVLANNHKAKVSTMIAIPYNPYEPKPYSRWTMAGMLDLDSELKVAEEFWNFLGGDGAYQDLLQCFERVGIALRPEIDKYFEKFKQQ